MNFSEQFFCDFLSLVFFAFVGPTTFLISWFWFFVNLNFCPVSLIPLVEVLFIIFRISRPLNFIYEDVFEMDSCHFSGAGYGSYVYDSELRPIQVKFKRQRFRFSFGSRVSATGDDLFRKYVEYWLKKLLYSCFGSCHFSNALPLIELPFFFVTSFINPIAKKLSGAGDYMADE